jgi:hypothetical protein
VDQPIAQLARGQIPHGECAEITGAAICPMRLWHAAEELVADIARMIHVRGEGILLVLGAAAVAGDHVAENHPAPA